LAGGKLFPKSDKRAGVPGRPGSSAGFTYSLLPRFGVDSNGREVLPLVFQKSFETLKPQLILMLLTGHQSGQREWQVFEDRGIILREVGLLPVKQRFVEVIFTRQRVRRVINEAIVRGKLLLVILLAIVVLPLLFVLLFALGFILYPLKGPEILEYSNGVCFHASSKDYYTKMTWSCADRKAPEQCPLIVHLQSGDMVSEYLSDEKGLKRDGWTEFGSGSSIQWYIKDRLVFCWFLDSKLVSVDVYVENQDENKTAVSVLGKRVPLPASGSTITQILGPPAKSN
jgi:hypothetical protein